MRTIAEPVVGSEVRVEPKETEGILINGIPAELGNAVPVFRIDLVQDNDRTFIAEHVLSVLGMYGITAAKVTGITENWDFARPEHRFCYSENVGPEWAVGHPAGLHNPTLVEALRTTDIVETGETTRTSVSEPVECGDGAIRIAPRESGTGLLLRNHHQGEVLTFDIDPQSQTDGEIIREITSSTTPFLTPDSREGAIHWIGDMVSDIGIIGGFDDLVIDSYEPGHNYTIGVSQKASDEGLVVQ
ncbi:hypothetical protein [Halomicrococcus sp. NG-SE-24]|uniref:hypothetical protein n=1 Tax=Halomicrococcus sp. NG-SE-24 TaxID=3436928 RepID=UPI003D99FE01